ncbi:hypothetical protein [Spirochaeta lutea]|uniref:Leader peptide processing enzyme n=1 Tax=Spirochaeta lutea TaxID=1480694 RepID=A0A098QW06_9SPIO|nr:hypothetical protein [Spirochaeta lutea]KGE71593.1 hypothetical protein DC28_09950 [Spirochaeta lutea]
MNKKVNSVLFVLGATVVNILLMLILFIGTFVLYGRFLAPLVDPSVSQFIVIFLFFASIILTYVLYNVLVNKLADKIDFDTYFDPIVKPRKRNKEK